MVNATRPSAADAEQKATSGHLDATAGMAELAVTVWGQHLRHDPADPKSVNCDRFWLCNGIARMLPFALLGP